MEWSETAFKNLPAAQPDRVFSNALPPQWHGADVRVYNKNKAEIHVGIGFEAVGWSHPHHFTFLIIQTIIGNWERNLGAGKHLTSPLAIALSSQGLVNSYQSFYTVYNQTGLFGLYLQIPGPNDPQYKGSSADAIQLAMTSYKMVADTLTEQELQKAKNKVTITIFLRIYFRR